MSNPLQHLTPPRRGRRSFRAVLARALPRRLPDLDVEVDYVVISLARRRVPRRSIDAFITFDEPEPARPVG